MGQVHTITANGTTATLVGLLAVLPTVVSSLFYNYIVPVLPAAVNPCIIAVSFLGVCAFLGAPSLEKVCPQFAPFSLEMFARRSTTPSIYTHVSAFGVSSFSTAQCCILF
jgi:hypothetical protein